MRALVVDEEPPVRSTVKSIVAEAGFHVTESDHGEHALSVIEEYPCFDLMVTEADPPGVNVKTLIKAFSVKCLLGRNVVLSEEADIAEINAESNGEWAVIRLRARQCVILLAEDEPVVRNFVRILLLRAGYAVIDASDGQEALDLSRAYKQPHH